MNAAGWLEKNAELVPDGFGGKQWVTKARGDYITLDGLEKDLSHLIPLTMVSSSWDAGKPVNIGFNEAEQKWYGWSHRAIFGFGVGSECKKGMCHYRPTDKDDFLADIVRFWTDDNHLNVVGEHREDGVYVEWEVSQSVPNEQARGKITGCLISYPEEYGRGEWTAETLADARQMAIDFANGVS
jgi:hypothetical protein